MPVILGLWDDFCPEESEAQAEDDFRASQDSLRVVGSDGIES